MRIAFDLDDTLIPSVHTFPTELPPRRLLSRLLCRIPVRLGATRLLRALTIRKHDIWIYTTSLRSCFSIRQLMNISGVNVGGVINGDLHARQCTNGCSKYPPAFGIDALVDDLAGVVLEGEHYGFRVIQVSPDDEQWVEKVLAEVDGPGRNREQLYDMVYESRFQRLWDQFRGEAEEG